MKNFIKVFGAVLIAYCLLPTAYCFSQNNRLWATYFGGTNNDAAYTSAADAFGNVYIAGMTMSDANIATPGAYQTAMTADDDAFLAKFNSAGALQWATYFGGGATGDMATSCTTDPTGNIYSRADFIRRISHSRCLPASEWRRK